MKQPTNTELILRLLGAKTTMEKANEFAPNALRQAREANPATRIRMIQLQQEIRNLKDAQGDARQAAATSLATFLVAPPKRAAKSLTCQKCGGPLTPGIAFCGLCGTKIG